MIFDSSQFRSKGEMFRHIRENKESIMFKKKSTLKRADGFSFSSCGGSNVKTVEDHIVKANDLIPNYQDLSEINIQAIINTTNYFDSHRDVHFDGIWKKSLQEGAGRIKHIQEHNRGFADIISDGKELKAFAKMFSWAELGESYTGNTQALVFDSKVLKSRNPFMFEQYAKGYVDNHSVGMQYVNIFLAENSESKWDIEEKENWEKYIGKIANQEAVQDAGYFYGVLEAKVIEGSAVPWGSNPITPTTYNNKSIETKAMDYNRMIEQIKQM